ncbi:MAG: FmdB family zinc ribbon protein [Kiritimatiellia bacterium]
MPIYEYQCASCGHVFEHLSRTRADVPTACAKCGAADPVKQLSTFAARTATAAGKACDACPATAACPAAGHGCGAACCHGH